MDNKLAQRVENAKLNNLQTAIVIALLNGYKGVDEKKQKQFDEDIIRIITLRKYRR